MTSVNLKTILDEQGPMRSSLLVKELTRGEGISEAAAKQRISRTRRPIRKFPIRLLPKNEAFLYLQKDRNSERFWDALVRDLGETRSIYGLALYGLKARGGLARQASFNVISGSPKAQKKQVPLSRVLETLIEAGLMKQFEFGTIGECVGLNQTAFGGYDLNAFRARTLAENLLMEGLRDWARNIGLASYNAIDIRTPECAPQFATFYWDLCGPSYLLPLVSSTRDATKPGFFVADVFCDFKLDVQHVRYFLRKVRLLKAMRRVRPFLPVLLADGYTPVALHEGHKAGVLMATTRDLFGETVANALTSLIETLTHAAAVVADDPDRIGKLLEALKAIEGRAGNLRGALFEMIVGYLVRRVAGLSIDIGKTVLDPDPDTGGAAEIDVEGIREGQECWIYECKGYQPESRVSSNEIKEWLKKVSRITRHYRADKRFHGYKFGFEFWTTGQFDEDALQLLEEEKERRRRRITLNWKNGHEVREYAKRAKKKSILDTLDQHYFKHPLARLT